MAMRTVDDSRIQAVVRRITGELSINAAALAALGKRGGQSPAKPLTIREARDLADAVRLI